MAMGPFSIKSLAAVLWLGVGIVLVGASGQEPESGGAAGTVGKAPQVTTSNAGITLVIRPSTNGKSAQKL